MSHRTQEAQIRGHCRPCYYCARGMHMREAGLSSGPQTRTAAATLRFDRDRSVCWMHLLWKINPETG